jgi:hypothetical protein
MPETRARRKDPDFRYLSDAEFQKLPKDSRLTYLKRAFERVTEEQRTTAARRKNGTSK